MKRTYRQRTFEAEQFDSETEPLPSGVTADSTSPTGFFIYTLGGYKPIAPGDYVRTGRYGLPERVERTEFEATYEPVE